MAELPTMMSTCTARARQPRYVRRRSNAFPTTLLKDVALFTFRAINPIREMERAVEAVCEPKAASRSRVKSTSGNATARSIDMRRSQLAFQACAPSP
eukprot:6186494-Pleurochrysis_carterae.AAC.2